MRTALTLAFWAVVLAVATTAAVLLGLFLNAAEAHLKGEEYEWPKWLRR